MKKKNSESNKKICNTKQNMTAKFSKENPYDQDKRPSIKKNGELDSKSKEYYKKLDEEYVEKYMQKFRAYIEDLISSKLSINNDIELNIKSYIFYIEERAKIGRVNGLTPEIEMRVSYLRYSADAVLDDINQKFDNEKKKEIKGRLIEACGEREDNLLYFVSSLQVDKKIKCAV